MTTKRRHAVMAHQKCQFGISGNKNLVCVFSTRSFERTIYGISIMETEATTKSKQVSPTPPSNCYEKHMSTAYVSRT